MENYPVFEKCFYITVGVGVFAVVIAATLILGGECSHLKDHHFDFQEIVCLFFDSCSTVSCSTYLFYF